MENVYLVSAMCPRVELSVLGLSSFPLRFDFWFDFSRKLSDSMASGRKGRFSREVTWGVMPARRGLTVHFFGDPLSEF